MKKQELWLNLPVKDLAKAKAFFTELGFESLRDAPGMAGFRIGQVPVMMVIEPEFEKYSLLKVSDSKKHCEVLISIDAPDKKYIDDMAKKVKAAGGTVFFEPAEIQGWMYNMNFADPDGHRWNILYMDHDKMN
jgi:predicted lactoylglutathione lyase